MMFRCVILQAALVAFVQALDSVTISHQTDLSGVAHIIAVDKGFYSQLGLDVDLIAYPSGDVQIEDQESWDFGSTDMVSSIFGGVQGLIVVGIAADQSATNQLVGTPEGVTIYKGGASLEGVPICVPPESTVEYVVRNCLRSQGYELDDVDFMFANQSTCLQAMMTASTNENETSAAAAAVTLSGLSSPNYNLWETMEGSQTLCSGASVYTTIVSGLVTRQEFAEENPFMVAQILAGWLRAVEFINNNANQEELLNYTSTLYKESGATLSQDSLLLETRLVGMFPLLQQLQLMEGRGEPPLSNYDIWHSEVINYLSEQGTLTEYADPSTYIDEQYMVRVGADAYLSPWAQGINPPITETIAARLDLSTFMEMLQVADLYAPLAGKAQLPYTIFAPSNDAFENLDPDLAAMLLPDAVSENMNLLIEILNYHITDTEGTVRSVDLAAKGQLTMRNMENATLCGNPPLIDDASIINADVLASNGVIHVIDKVIIPPSMRGNEDLNVTCLDAIEVEEDAEVEMEAEATGNETAIDDDIGMEAANTDETTVVSTVDANMTEMIDVYETLMTDMFSVNETLTNETLTDTDLVDAEAYDDVEEEIEVFAEDGDDSIATEVERKVDSESKETDPMDEEAGEETSAVTVVDDVDGDLVETDAADSEERFPPEPIESSGNKSIQLTLVFGLIVVALVS